MSSKGGWTVSDAPSQAGRVAVVTGANSGIGLATAIHLAHLDATVVLACRNADAAQQARRVIIDDAPGTRVEVVTLDLSDLASVQAAADTLGGRYPAIDILINNAGLMRRERELTVDGFEMDFGTNFLGHFALTGLLFDALAAARDPRIVTVGSMAHRAGKIRFDDIAMDRRFSSSAAYARSKLAELVFAVELQRRIAKGGARPASLAAHPGSTHSGVMRDQHATLQWLFTTPSLRWLRRSFIMDPPAGALPSVRAATDPGAFGGQYFGPAGRLGFAGPPVPVLGSRQMYDVALGERLWRLAEKLTGVRYPLP